MAKISVLLLTQNSQRSIKKTMDSLTMFDEVVVIDGGSTDQTLSIVSQYSNARVVHNEWPGFIAQRNFSIDQARNEWCFMIDSDEVCTPELAQKLHDVVEEKEVFPLYRVMRSEFFLGQEITSGHGKSAYQERLFQKSRVRYAGGVHHNHLIDGKYVGGDHPEVKNLEPNFRVLHDQDYGMDEWLQKFARFSILIANEKIEAGKKTSALGVLFSFVHNFIKAYKRSWRNGRLGFILSILHALHRCMVAVYIYQYRHFDKSMASNFRSQKLG